MSQMFFKDLLLDMRERNQQYITALSDNTFARPSSDVGLHFRAVRERFSPNAEVVSDAICQVFDFHPQRRAALYIHRHYLTNTWSARRGVCTGNTKTLDTAFNKSQKTKL